MASEFYLCVAMWRDLFHLFCDGKVIAVWVWAAKDLPLGKTSNAMLIPV